MILFLLGLKVFASGVVVGTVLGVWAEKRNRERRVLAARIYRPRSSGYANYGAE